MRFTAPKKFYKIIRSKGDVRGAVHPLRQFWFSNQVFHIGESQRNWLENTCKAHPEIRTDMGLLSLIHVRIVAASSAFSHPYCAHQPHSQMNAMTNKNF